VWDTSATSTDTASNDPASLKTTVGHTQSYDGSLHAVGDDGPSAWYTLDKTDVGKGVGNGDVLLIVAYWMPHRSTIGIMQPTDPMHTAPSLAG
jgi:hypothetical protein